MTNSSKALQDLRAAAELLQKDVDNQKLLLTMRQVFDKSEVEGLSGSILNSKQGTQEANLPKLPNTTELRHWCNRGAYLNKVFVEE